MAACAGIHRWQAKTAAAKSRDRDKHWKAQNDRLRNELATTAQELIHVKPAKKSFDDVNKTFEVKELFDVKKNLLTSDKCFDVNKTFDGNNVF